MKSASKSTCIQEGLHRGFAEAPASLIPHSPDNALSFGTACAIQI
jgi:hypothetical protein